MLAIMISPQSQVHPAYSYHYTEIMMSVLVSQIIGISLFFQPFVEAHIKENIKAQRHWPLWGESTGDMWTPLTKGQ